ncbi:Triosephosphate isomerase [hydrothermal vent metagenome]|uniref:triose-phosphate isomerase n=1 Tax=hydrothermal vent metagenome TaxID=652676 RepID=A0A3B1D973_9ZZZZ
MRKLIIAGNWKLNNTISEAVQLIAGIKRELNGLTDVDVVVCPVFTALADVHDVLLESNIGLGAQNLYLEDSGAFTGEVSAPLIKDAGAEYVIIGHSERRQYFGETSEIVNKKVKAALKHDLKPIVCVGEILEERESDKTFDVIQKQCEESLAGLTVNEMQQIIIAYEPVWAIGTGKTATPQQAQEVHKFIRNLLRKLFDDVVANTVCIQYGGSVKPENAAELMSQLDIDGALVGGASLKADSFVGIIKNSCGVVSA